MSDLIKDLEITALTHGGRGIGRHDGKAVFVPMTAPGDHVVCSVLRSRKNYVEAELVAVDRPSPSRREPPCPYFGECGGCQWQHLPYVTQLHWKEQLFAEQLLRHDLLSADALLPIVPSMLEWQYRNRVQFKCFLTDHGLAVGFYRHGSHFVVDVDCCRLLSPVISRLYGLLREELPGCPHPGAVPQVDVAAGDDGDLRMILHVLPDVRPGMRKWLKGFAERHRVNGCLQSGRKDTLEVVHGLPSLHVHVDEPRLSLEYGPGGFAQVNSAQNRNMVVEMLSWLELQGEDVILDLFCGMGNFSLPLARRAKQVIGVEDYGPSIDYARHNAVSNGVANADFHAADAARFLNRFKPGDFDLVVLDPPRTGHYQAAREILRLAPRQVLYVSCDPATLARDLKPLVHGGYRVVRARPFDLFPQTWHIESMTMLERT